jgi:hypothetical protein
MELGALIFYNRWEDFITSDRELFISPFSFSEEIEWDEIGRTYSIHLRREKCMQNFNRETRRKDNGTES